MCSSKLKSKQQQQPNRAPLLERRNNSTSNITGDDDDGPHNKLFFPAAPCSPRIRSKTTTTTAEDDDGKPRPRSLLNKSKSFSYSSSNAAAGSIAAARREQVATLHEQRKLRIAHYGRTASKSSSKLLDVKENDLDIDQQQCSSNDNKRCSFITPNSDPIYVAYHDHEWGVPVHDDERLFELLVLSGAQVGSEWSSVLKKRELLREAFSGFSAEAVSRYSEKKVKSISWEQGIEESLVRGAVDNAKRILQIKQEVGSLDSYLWGFVNHRAIATAYKWAHKIPVKTSKSETISKDMLRRGFRHVGPTVIHSFMQAAGLTNDHLITCPAHKTTTTT